MTTLVTKDEADRISQAITTAERKTSGEIVAMITEESASYFSVPILWAAIAALLLPWPFIYWTWWPIQHIYLMQIVVFFALGVLLHWRPADAVAVPEPA